MNHHMVVKSNYHSQIKAILFDLDGVLVNSYDAWFKLFNNTLKHFGYKPVTKKTFMGEWGKSTKEDVKYFMPNQTIKEVREYYSRTFPKFIKYVKVTPGAVTILKKLKKHGFILGCVTNSHADITKQMIQKARLGKYFTIVICADQVPRPKPAPDMLIKAMKKIRVSPCETLFVGDTKTDLVAGKRAKCLTIGYKLKSRYQIKSLQNLTRLTK